MRAASADFAARDDEIVSIIPSARAGDQEAKARLVELCRDMIGAEAHKVGRGRLREELMQDGVVGLLEALSTFDPTRGRFRVWARFKVRDAMRGGSSHLERAATMSTSTVRRALSTAPERRGRFAAAALAPCVSIDQQLAAETGNAFEAVLTERQATTTRSWERLHTAVEALDGSQQMREARALLLLLLDGEGETVVSAARTLGISRDAANRRLKLAYRALGRVPV